MENSMTIGLKIIHILGFILFAPVIFCQGNWMVRELNDMPEPVANNAVVSIRIDDHDYVYSFGGIDTTKIWSGIHKRCYKYDVTNDIWTPLPDLPNGNGRIASGASVVGDKIYVIGGYEVFSNHNERSFASVHVFDPVGDTFMADGQDLLYPIDDHIQGVWRDSLIYVIMGWSNTTNVFRVQVYNPATDEWSAGTSVPNTNDFKVFGGSGCIVGDTIYYAGGASLLGAFNPTQYMRKGIINPANPLEITWSGWADNDARGYRMASSQLNGNPIWFGGSQVTYNFNGIAYNGSGGVAPNGNIKWYDVQADSFHIWENIFPPHMDFRGAGHIAELQFILAGGMTENQKVSNRTFLLTYDENTDVHIIEDLTDVSVFPNPFISSIDIKSAEPISQINVFDNGGNLQTVLLDSPTVQLDHLSPGVYVLKIELKNGHHIFKNIVKIQ